MATAGRGGKPPHSCGGEQGRPDGDAAPRPGELRAGGAATHHGGRFAGAQAAGLTVAIENAASRVPSLRSYWRRLAYVTRTARPLLRGLRSRPASASRSRRAVAPVSRGQPPLPAGSSRWARTPSPPCHRLRMRTYPPPPPPNCAVASQARLGDGGRSVELRVPSFPMETGAGGGGSKQVGRSVRGAFCNIWGFGVGRLFGFFSWCHQEIKELFSFWDSLLLSLLRYERGRESPGEGRPGSWMEVSKMNGNPLKS